MASRVLFKASLEQVDQLFSLLSGDFVFQGMHNSRYSLGWIDATASIAMSRVTVGKHSRNSSSV
jgi:hypothetical protein